MFKRPKQVNYRKQAKLGIPKSYVQPLLRYGQWGRYATEYGRVTARQLEAARRVIRFRMSRQGKLWIPRFPHRPYTAKPTEVRMGGGAGSVKFWGQMVKPGSMRFELGGVTEAISVSACHAASKKLGIRTRRIQRVSLVKLENE